VASWSEHGRAAAELVAQELTGQSPATAQVRDVPTPSCVIDARQLSRWGISEGRVPRGCELRFRVPSFWEANRNWIAAGAVLAALLVLIGLALLQQTLRRRGADAELQRQRTEIAHAARLAMIGELTASIAHEINQPLGAILSNADAAEMIIESDPKRVEAVQDILEAIRREGLRASEVIRHIRALLKRRQVEGQRMSLNGVVTEILPLLTVDAELRGVALEPQLTRELPDVVADGVHVRQVLLNLVLNAMDAMNGLAGPRRVTIETSLSPMGVTLSIADSGPGIPPERLRTIFESFYTTKADGLGLGLSIARSLAEANGGRLWAENRGTGGAVFHFSLPIAVTPATQTSELESVA
jgi:C4-dicarboxylate-specific signal transduction histidine kinase